MQFELPTNCVIDKFFQPKFFVLAANCLIRLPKRVLIQKRMTVVSKQTGKCFSNDCSTNRPQDPGSNTKFAFRSVIKSFCQDINPKRTVIFEAFQPRDRIIV